MENLWELSHMFVTVFLSAFAVSMVTPVITDVTVDVLCHGKDECSLAIYLTGFQQAITGLGSVIAMPLLGNLSDTYGRKTILTIPMTLAIIPLVILAWKRTRSFFFAYYALKTLFAMITDGGIFCLSYSYLGDIVPEVNRVAVFSASFGVACGANVCGSFVARIFSIPHIFQVSTFLSIVALLYMRVFLKETLRENDAEILERPFLKQNTETCGSSKKIAPIDQFSLPMDLFRLLKSSSTFALAAFVGFFNSLSEDGCNVSLMYFLKARFHFKKEQFAVVFLIVNIGATLSNVVFMPLLGPIIGEETLLCFGLFSGVLSMLLNSIAWSPLVPYSSSMLGMFFNLSTPCVRSIVSKQVGPNDQGIAQGIISGIASLANVISPLIFSPLSALFLSDQAPFNFPGFALLCIAFSYLIGFIASIVLKFTPNILSRDRISNPRMYSGEEGLITS